MKDIFTISIISGALFVILIAAYIVASYIKDEDFFSHLFCLLITISIMLWQIVY